MKTKIVVFCVVTCLAVPVYAEFPERVTIGEMTIECRTVEEIRALGFECEDIPWQENAARVQIEAINACIARGPEFYRRLDKGFKALDFGEDAARVREWLDAQ
jgi:hypothetical protein